MDFAQKKKKIYRAAIYGIAVIFGLFLIGISIVRASLDATIKDDNAGNLRKVPFEFDFKDNQGNIKPVSYKLPEIGMVSDSPFYIFKKVRDTLWIKFSSESIKKGKISLLLADKKIAEADFLFKENKPELALRCSCEAFEKLKYSQEQIEKSRENNDQIKQIKNQIFWAGLAYEKILEKYQKTIKGLNDWNEKLEKNIQG